MVEWVSVDEHMPPEGEQVLLYWNDSGHMEDGAIYEDDIGISWYHALFDGESLYCPPTHWAKLPEPPK